MCHSSASVASRPLFSSGRRESVGLIARSLCWDDGSIVSSPEDLCGTFSSFYSSLFFSEPVDSGAQDSLFQAMESTLSEDQADACEGLLSSEECFTALKGMAHNKAPGIDGLPMSSFGMSSVPTLSWF